MGLKSWFAEKYVSWETKKELQELDKISISVPLPLKSVKQVLVILPRQMEYVDAAVSLVHDLKRQFSGWKFMVLDIDKMLPQKLNRLDLPNHQFISELGQKHFDLVLDLNDSYDLRIAYLLVKLKIPYRLHLAEVPDNYYNIFVQPGNKQKSNFSYVLDYLKKIFIHEASEKREELLNRKS